MASLQKRTITGIFWSLLQKAGSRAITFFVIIILARVLTPEEFGLIGMLTIFIELSNVLINAGFNQALIQKKTVDDVDYSTVFFINLFVSLLLYFILFFSAPLISLFYQQPLLTSLTRVLSLVFVINAFSFIQDARLTKAMQFKKLMYIQVPSTILGGIVGVILAVAGVGVWSLVALQLTMRMAYSFQIWLYEKWRPLFHFDASRARSLFSFGSKLMAVAVIQKIYDNIYLVIIGRFFPLSSVGFYQNANNFIRYPIVTLTTALSTVTFSAFSSIQNDDDRLKEGFKNAVSQIFFLLTPFFVLAGVLAIPLFDVVLTEKWRPAVPYFQWLCLVGILYPLNIYNSTIVNVKGRSDIFLKLEIIKKIFVTIGIVIAIPFGVMALVMAQAFNCLIEYLLSSYFAGKVVKYRTAAQLRDFFPVLLLNVTVGYCIIMLDNQISHFSSFFRLLIGGTAGLLLYWLIAHSLNLPAYRELKNFFLSKLKIAS